MNREQLLAQCHGKYSFTESVARAIVKRDHGKHHAYHCPNCGNWHLASAGATSKKGGDRKRTIQSIRERELLREWLQQC